MAKSVVIGIGGTGLSAIRELRRLIAERYEEGLQDPAVRSLRFLYIDTDRNDAKRRPSWEVLGKDISLQEGEKVEITGDKLAPMVQNPKDFGEVADWLPAIADYVGDPGEGAKGIRPYGRLIYEYSENKDRIHDALIGLRDSLNEAFRHDPDWRFYLVCSLSGGTGSGMFLPLAQDLVRWRIFERGMTGQKLRAFLVLPPVQISRRHDRYHANAFAALKELNYLGVRSELPFNSTYLIEPVNESCNEIGLDNLPLLIAQRLFLNVQGGEAAGKIDALMDNTNVGELQGDDTNRKHALSFSSFGLSSISYPRETIARSVALQWAAGAVANWLQERDAPQNVNQVVRADLSRLHLSRLHVNGDGDPFGNNELPPHETELPNQVDGKIGPLEKRQLGPAGHRIREEIETTFRQVGIEGFYQQREKDVRRAAEYAVNHIRLSVSRQIRDPQRGIRFAKEYLGELGNILDKEFKTEAALRFGEAAQKQVAVFQRNFGETVNTISQHEEAMMYWDKEFARDKANLEDELKAYLVRKAGYWSGKYALSLLNLVIPVVSQLRSELDVWQTKISDLLGKLRGRLQVSLQGRAENPRENGTVIFDMAILEKVSKEAPAEIVNPAIEARLTQRLAKLFERTLEDLDLFLLSERDDVDALIEAAAFEYILSTESPINVRRTTLYDRFVTEYPNPPARRELLQQTRRLSEVFARSVPEEVGRRPVRVTTAKVVSIPNVTGRLTRNNEEAQAVVRKDIEAIGVSAGDIQATQDVERIVFVTEKQAFPIRFIESVKELKKYYDRFPIRDALHIDKRDVGQMFELFLLSDRERTLLQEAEEAFLLARANGWIAPAKNQMTLKPEIRYEYEMPGKIGKRTANLGPDWDSAFERFTQDAISANTPDGTFREGRVLLTEKAKATLQESKVDPARWNTLFESMKLHLDTTLETYRARTDDPKYIRDTAIITRIVENHNA